MSIGRYVHALPIPDEFAHNASDSPDEFRNKEKMRAEFRNMYAQIISQPSVDAMIKALAPYIHRNFFVLLLMPDTYYELNNPGSRKALAKLHEKGILTIDSDIFYVDDDQENHDAQHPMREYTVNMMRRKLGDTVKIPENLYVKEIQYGYVDALVQKQWLETIDISKLPDLTTCIWVKSDKEYKVTNRGIVPNTETTISNTRHISIQPGAPPMFLYNHGMVEPNVHVGLNEHDLRNASHIPMKHRVGLYEGYDRFVLVDHDYHAQKKNPNRAIETMYKLFPDV